MNDKLIMLLIISNICYAAVAVGGNWGAANVLRRLR